MFDSGKVFDVFLQPGEYFFGGRETRIRTVLGSCVSLVFWHPHLLLGGMCHYMLPGRGRSGAQVLDGRYADEAVELMMRELRACGTRLNEYQVRMFGGGNMFPGIAREGKTQVGSKNVLAARELMRRHGVVCVAEHVEGVGHRNLTFHVGSGDVTLKHTANFRSEVEPGANSPSAVTFSARFASPVRRSSPAPDSSWIKVG